jgi:hypothetical protein
MYLNILYSQKLEFQTSYAKISWKNHQIRFSDMRTRYVYRTTSRTNYCLHANNKYTELYKAESPSEKVLALCSSVISPTSMQPEGALPLSEEPIFLFHS